MGRSQSFPVFLTSRNGMSSSVLAGMLSHHVFGVVGSARSCKDYVGGGCTGPETKHLLVNKYPFPEGAVCPFLVPSIPSCGCRPCPVPGRTPGPGPHRRVLRVSRGPREQNPEAPACSFLCCGDEAEQETECSDWCGQQGCQTLGTGPWARALLPLLQTLPDPDLQQPPSPG